MLTYIHLNINGILTELTQVKLLAIQGIFERSLDKTEQE